MQESLETQVLDEKPENRSIEEWRDVDVEILRANMNFLRNKDFFKADPEGYQEKVSDVYRGLVHFFKDYGGVFSPDVNEIYKKYSSGQPIIVRREDPVSVLNLVKGMSREFDFDPEIVGSHGDKYANCALWPYGPVNTTTGLANAFLEGHSAIGPIAMVMGFKNNPDHMTLEEPLDKMMHIGTISRLGVKAVSGVLEKDDLEFVIFRMPVKFFQHEELTDWEKKQFHDGKLQQVFRGFSFPKMKVEKERKIKREDGVSSLAA